MKSIITALSLLVVCALPAQTGNIRGNITSAENGEPIIGATVRIEDPFMGAVSDFDGNFSIDNVPVGTYTVIISYTSFTTQEITNTIVQDGTTTKLNIALSKKLNITGPAVIDAKAIDNTENALLAMRKKALNVQDAMSAEEMDRTGGGSAAETMKSITGVSITDGKYLNVRGLGDRYSSAQLNGMMLASTDPNSNSVQLDLVPSNLLDNIIATKTFTPDQPGNFTGGNVNINTKSFPEELTLNFSTSIGYNSQASFQNEFLTSDRGKYDWLGYDDGRRGIPAVLQDTSVLNQLNTSFYVKARKDSALAQILDQTSNSLSYDMAPVEHSSFTDYGFSFSFGNQYKIGKNPLGVLFGINYSRNYDHYNNGVSASYDLPGQSATGMVPYSDLVDTRSSEVATVNSLLNISYKITPKNEIGFNVIYNHDGDLVNRYQEGILPGVVSSANSTFQTRTIHFIERELATYQLRGRHDIGILNNAQFEWIGGITRSFQDEPDLRFFANEEIINDSDTNYVIRASEYTIPSHYFRNLQDLQGEFKADLSIPLGAKENGNKLKFGGLIRNKDRDFKEQIFQYETRPEVQGYNGDPQAYFDAENIGIVGYDSSRGRYQFGQYIVNASIPKNNYSGMESVKAGYGMLVYSLTSKLKTISGLRAEHTSFLVASEDTTRNRADTAFLNLLPSINLIYVLNEKMNLRAAYTHTLARPSMRELAPFESFNFIGDETVVGNPKLTPTLIKNVDLRWEYFNNPGEIIAISAFYKRFTDPIVRVYNTQSLNPSINFRNSNDAEVYGLEFEVRKEIKNIWSTLKGFKVGANLALIQSRVALDSMEYTQKIELNPETRKYRPFAGQSPYLINAFFGYENDSIQLYANLNYNVFGERLVAIGNEGVPDVFEQPRSQLNFNISKGLGKHFTAKFSVNNIFNAEYLQLHRFNGEDYISQKYTLGRSITLGFSYGI